MPVLKNSKRENFCQHYAKDCNGAESAVLAGYSKKTAKSIASRMLTFVDVAERIRELQDKASEKYGISMQVLVNEYQKIGMATDAETKDSDKIKALDSMTKILGGFVDKKGLDIGGAIKISWEEEELDE